jgi:tetratricopeptide (TPR) repeat protein
MLAYAYDRTGDLENAIWAINRYISLAPNEANPYDSRGDIYANNREYDLAIDSYRKALEKKPDFFNSWWKLSNLLMRTHRVDEADSCYQLLRRSERPEIAFIAGFYQPIVEVWRGRLNRALEMIEQHIVWTRKERPRGVFPSFYTIKALIHHELGNLDSALTAVRQGQERYRETHAADSSYVRWFEIQLLAELGRFSEAAATAESLKGFAQANDMPLYDYQYGLGVIAMHRGELEAAERYLMAASKDSTSRSGIPLYMVAQVYLKAGRYAEAVDLLDSLTVDVNRWSETSDLWLVKSHYYLGLAYEGMGDATRAAEQYTWLIETWKDADVSIPVLTDAKERLARLKN